MTRLTSRAGVLALGAPILFPALPRSDAPQNRPRITLALVSYITSRNTYPLQRAPPPLDRGQAGYAAHVAQQQATPKQQKNHSFGGCAYCPGLASIGR